MRYSIVLLSSIIVLSTASPAPKIIGNDDIAKRSPEEIKLKDGTVITVTDAKAKRSPEEIKLKDGTTITVTDDAKRKRSPHDVQLRDGSWLSVRDLAVAEKREASLSKREDDKISSCGPKSGWIPVEDHGSPAISPNGLQFWGFKSAVQEYCSRISYDFNGNPVIVASGKATSYTVRWKYDDPTMQDDQRDNRIGLKNEVPGHIECKFSLVMSSWNSSVDVIQLRFTIRGGTTVPNMSSMKTIAINSWRTCGMKLSLVAATAKTTRTQRVGLGRYI